MKTEPHGRKSHAERSFEADIRSLGSSLPSSSHPPTAPIHLDLPEALVLDNVATFDFTQHAYNVLKAQCCAYSNLNGLSRGITGF